MSGANVELLGLVIRQQHNGVMIMSCWTKPELENMLEDVVNELNLSDGMIEKHGPLGTAPAELVRIILERKDQEIRALKQGFIAV